MSQRRIPSHLVDLVREPPHPALSEKPPHPTLSPEGRRNQRIDTPHSSSVLEELVAATPSKVATGRTGTRYRTETYLGVRSDHAIAKDAVYAETGTELAQQLGCIEVVSRCTDREHYLLNPNQGRRLSDESRQRLEQTGTRGADVQIIVADGLAAPALQLNGPVLLASFTTALQARGVSVGTPILAHMARVGLQDDIGVLLTNRATAICLGERPGLGTGDSLSIYIAIGPKLDQDNAEKNCISNIRPLGLSPDAAALAAADLIVRGLATGVGGLVLAHQQGVS